MCTPQLTIGRYTTIMPDNGISGEGIAAIRNYLRYCPPLPPDWAWRARVGGHGEYVGTFPKRVAKYYHSIGHKIDSDMMGTIGSMVAEYCPSSDPYYWDICDLSGAHDWIGKFGDQGSCFGPGGCHSAAPMTMHAAGVLAVRFYRGPDYTRPGIGRAWLRVCDGCGYIVLFNAYGLAALMQARILATHFGCSYTSCSVTNPLDSVVYVNSGAQMLGPVAAMDQHAVIDLRIPPVWHLCECCESRQESVALRVVGHYSIWICDTCWERDYASCDNCDMVFEHVEAEEDCDRILCPDCHDHLYTQCAKCGADCLRDMTVCDDRTLCADCVDQVCLPSVRDDMTVRDDRTVCPDCNREEVVADAI